MELNKILSDGRWGDMAALVNANFEKIKVELMKLRFSSILTFCKGYFSTEARLVAKYPSGKTGEYAFVGTPWPGTVWEWIDTKWVDTGVAPQLGESVFVELLKRHIDNKTILFDDREKYIYSLGGGGGGTGKLFTISVSVNPADAGRVEVTAVGDEVQEVVASADRSNYTVIAGAVSDVTLNFIAKTGYNVKTVEVDDADQGSVTSYTFKSINANHTVYIRMDVDVSYIIPPVYIRSDNDRQYLGIYNATRSVMEDYPGGLTRDVTITCTQDVIDYKGNRSQVEDSMWSVDMKGWNQETPYVLTIDGADRCTLDGRGFGGIHIEECSNIIIRNITFQNFNTYEGVYAPEEPACIYASNISQEKPCRNLYFENLTVKGQSTKSPNSIYRTRYGITVKGYENVCLHNISMSQVVVRPISVTDANTVYVSRLKFSESVMQAEVIGHPSIMDLSATDVYIMDCDIDGSYYNEAAISVGKVSRMFFERNHIYNTRGPVLGISNELGTDRILIANNYLHDNDTYPKYQWDCTWLTFPNMSKEIVIANNTVVFSSGYFQEFFARSNTASADRLVNVNNVFVRHNEQNHGIFLLSSISELISGNNIYNKEGILYSMADSNSPVYFPGNTQGNLAHIQKQGYENGTLQIADGSTVLMDDRPCLLPGLASAHKSVAKYVREFDYKYQLNTPDNTSIGCENYFSGEFDETADMTDGYDGINYYNDDVFSSAAQYSMPSDQTLVLLARSKNRDKMVVFNITKSDDADSRIVSIGRLASLSIRPKVDENGEYVADQLYDVTIE